MAHASHHAVGLCFLLVNEVHRQTLIELQRALDDGDFETGFQILERASSRARDAADRGWLALRIAALYALYGRDGLEGLQRSLEDATINDARLQDDALLMVLRANGLAFSVELDTPPAEIEVIRAQGLELVERARAKQFDDDAVTRFYGGAGLVSLGDPERAIAVLEPLKPEDLPGHLQWRLFSWRGGAFEDWGRFRDASLAYHHGAARAVGLDRAALLQDKAAMLLELEEAHEALATLNESREAVFGMESALDAANRLQLEARAHLVLENPRLARERAEAAATLEAQANEPSFGVSLVLGQALASLEEWDTSIQSFQRAVALAQPLDKGFALHEMGLAQMDAGFTDDARLSLQRALQDEAYPNKAEIHADLAELEYRLGIFDAAEREAEIALELGAIVPASLMLANIAYEYYRLEEALDHYGRALEHAPEGNRDWALAHQMTADTLVQLGWRDPERILHHASLALPHVDSADEWAITLEMYIEKARQLLTPSGQPSRTLN